MKEHLNKADWIALYGSDELKERWYFADGKYSFIIEYLKERLTYEYPGFIIYGINPKVPEMDNLADAWFVDDYKDLKFLSDKIRTKRAVIINNEAPSLNTLKLARSYDRDVDIKLLQSINISSSHINECLGWIECLYIDNWLDIFIIYKPIAPAEKKIDSIKRKAANYYESQRETFYLDLAVSLFLAFVLFAIVLANYASN